MKAAVWHGRGDIRIEEVPEPQVGPGQVKVRIEFCGICGSDLHEYTSGPFLIPSRPHPLTGRAGGPMILGHELSGEVIEAGEGVTTVSPGDRVTVNPLIYCGECHFCRKGIHIMCSKLATVGLAWDGGFAEYGVFPEYTIHTLPEGLTFEVGACVEPLAVAVHAVIRSGLKIGDTAVVVGAGPIGLLVQQVCKTAGASQVFVSELITSRLKTAGELGANAVFDPTDVNLGKEIAKRTGGLRADIAFDCVGSQQTYDACVSSTGRRGRICIVGLPLKPLEVSFMRLWGHEKELTFSQGYEAEFPAAISYLADGRVRLDGYITKHIALDDLVEGGIKELIGNPGQNIKILVAL